MQFVSFCGTVLMLKVNTCVNMLQVANVDGTKDDEQSKDKKPLLSKSAVLRLLAELSRSYAGCAVLLCQHTYHAGQSDLITDVSTVYFASFLASFFILGPFFFEV